MTSYEGEEKTIPIEQAAEELGISPKRLLGFCFRNKVGDPISDGRYVYPSSLEGLRRRLATDRENERG